jgi:hypothetical protein
MYSIDATKLTIRDVANLVKAGQSNNLDALLPIMNKCVLVEDGRKAEDLPASHLAQIITAIVTRVSGEQNPK